MNRRPLSSFRHFLPVAWGGARHVAGSISCWEDWNRKSTNRPHDAGGRAHISEFRADHLPAGNAGNCQQTLSRKEDVLTELTFS